MESYYFILLRKKPRAPILNKVEGLIRGVLYSLKRMFNNTCKVNICNKMKTAIF